MNLVQELWATWTCEVRVLSRLMKDASSKCRSIRDKMSYFWGNRNRKEVWGRNEGYQGRHEPFWKSIHRELSSLRCKWITVQDSKKGGLLFIWMYGGILTLSGSEAMYLLFPSNMALFFLRSSSSPFCWAQSVTDCALGWITYWAS